MIQKKKAAGSDDEDISDVNSGDEFDALIKDAPVRQKTERRAASKVCLKNLKKILNFNFNSSENRLFGDLKGLG